MKKVKMDMIREIHDEGEKGEKCEKCEKCMHEWMACDSSRKARDR